MGDGRTDHTPANSSQSLRQLPILHFVLSTRRHPDYGFITIGGRRYFKIENIEDFLSALGYTKAINQTGTDPDSYVWDTFTCSSASKSAGCLQTQIATYLFAHSETFRREFGRTYFSATESCDPAVADDSILCTHCVKRTDIAERSLAHNSFM
jgi:hypothetical protein